MTSPDELTGACGTAHRIPAENYSAVNPAALDGWIITAPLWHPAWHQYLLGVITLDEIPDLPPAIKTAPGMTHELMVLALDPSRGPYDALQVRQGDLALLLPINVSEQFTGTDDQARQLAELATRAVVDGRLNPETSDAPTRIRAEWHAAIAMTLDHFRDPHHGRAN